ncbi:hypothetical protein Leryth_002316 [Lithospermum erythrorhizon]|nr:hypothetical protein Leryth_002316 [Lithospermum erythrorhizon]
MRMFWGKRPELFMFSRRSSAKSEVSIDNDESPSGLPEEEKKHENELLGRGGGEEEEEEEPITNAEHSASSCNESELESAITVSEDNADEQFFSIGPKRLFSLSSISISSDEWRCSSINEDKTLESIGEVHDNDSEGETPTSGTSTSDVEANSQEKPEFQLRGFFRKLKRGSPFHPSLPSVNSLKKSAAKKVPKSGGNDTQSIATETPQIEASLFYGFESSWKNFTLSELKAATDNFSEENLIAEGGYSAVYKGTLDYGQLVAVKKLKGSHEETTSDYLSELGILVHVKHPNISNVIGYGVEDGMHLVLPLSPYGSLESMLKGQREQLTWSCRFKIALGTASALAYLHEDCQRRIIHRDIKAANILLTEDFEAQICDFGLAKWLPEQWSHLTVSQYEGTFGYLPPEYFLHGIVDEKTDVYSYGVVLLEIITGRPAIDESHNSVVMWAKPLLMNKDIEGLVDPSLMNIYDSEQLNRMIMVASLCIHQSPSERPQMSKVTSMLQGEEKILQNKGKFQRRPPVLKRSTPRAIKVEE